MIFFKKKYLIVCQWHPQSRQAALACTFGEVVLLDLGVSVDLVAEAVLGREGVCPDEAARRPVFS